METEMRPRMEVVAAGIDRIAGMLAVAGKCSLHQEDQPLAGLGAARRDLIEELAFDAAAADGEMLGKTVPEREPLLQYQYLLAVLKQLAGVVLALADILQRQIQEGIPFSDRILEQIGDLFRRQDHILTTCAAMARGTALDSRETGRACREVIASCLQYATDHETRLAEGLCLPVASPIFLAVLGHMQTLTHFELDLVRRLRSLMEWQRPESARTITDRQREES